LILEDLLRSGRSTIHPRLWLGSAFASCKLVANMLTFFPLLQFSVN
jgi:hypothetical protein